MIQQIKQLRQDILNEQSRYHYIATAQQLLDITEEKGTIILMIVQLEIKCNSNHESVEPVIKKRGFRSFRELYTKKINELELNTRQLRDQARNFKVYIF